MILDGHYIELAHALGENDIHETGESTVKHWMNVLQIREDQLIELSYGQLVRQCVDLKIENERIEWKSLPPIFWILPQTL